MKRKSFICIFVLFVILLPLAGALAFEDNQSYVYEETSYVYVSGTLSPDYSGSNVSLLLVDSEVSSETPEKEDIGHIDQTIVKNDGSYEFRFKFSGFEFDANGEEASRAIRDLGGSESKYYHMVFNSFGYGGVDWHPYYTEHEAMGQELTNFINSIDNIWD